MKVLYDPFCFSEFYGGVSRYFSEVINGLPNEVDYSIPLKYTNNEYYSILNLPYKEFFKNNRFKGQCSIIKMLNIPELRKNIRSDTFDIYHQTHYDTYAFDLLPRTTKKIVTIHDMNFFAIPEFYEEKNKLKEKQTDSIRKADHIITVSQNTKKDLIKFFDIPETSISVIYHGASRLNSDIKPYCLDRPYILFVGSRNAYKNFGNTILAFKELNRNRDFYLVCTGSPFNKHEIELLNKLNILDSVIQIKASETVLNSLYRGALCFIYPSFYEGFGIPLLEAMTNMCPIICSSRSCFPEIVDDAGLFFDPDSVDDIRNKIEQIANSHMLRVDLIKRGKERVKNFSWEKSAHEHFNLYQSIIGS